eukprot:CAMPEP_0171935788 /NCGR_PEP_ID=MMETSP0993-20121228/33246_1 /TAXON_ID=483369 /ORGANISM="non described non described, Strain CCMP2098" /LENGTH=426 /DNA_ID=CAMNT_0012576801 /DNA_START=30 /DNA_END=1307 /DNA_ORIENTATION=+
MWNGLFGGGSASKPTASQGPLHEEGTVECRTCGTEQPFTRHRCMECGKDPWATPEEGFSPESSSGGRRKGDLGNAAAALPPLPAVPSLPSAPPVLSVIDRMQLADQESVRLITSQGVSEEWARFALASCRGDVDASVCFLFSTDVEAALRAAVEATNPTEAAASSSSAALHESYATTQVADDHAECAICFEPLCSKPCAVFVDNKHKRVCHHFFHKACADDLSSNFRDCPLCRAKFTTTLEVPDIDADPEGWYRVCDKDGDGDLNTREVFEILKAQFPIDHVRLEKDLPKLWQRWDPSMDGQIQKHEFLGPGGLLAFVRQNFIKQASLGGVDGGMPDIRRDKLAWFNYFDEDGSGELSQQEVARGLVKSLHVVHSQGGVRAVDDMKRTVASLWGLFDGDGSGEIDRGEFVARDGLADTVIASLAHS